MFLINRGSMAVRHCARFCRLSDDKLLLGVLLLRPSADEKEQYNHKPLKAWANCSNNAEAGGTESPPPC